MTYINADLLCGISETFQFCFVFFFVFVFPRDDRLHTSNSLSDEWEYILSPVFECDSDFNISRNATHYDKIETEKHLIRSMCIYFGNSVERRKIAWNPTNFGVKHLNLEYILDLNICHKALQWNNFHLIRFFSIFLFFAFVNLIIMNILFDASFQNREVHF